MERAWIIILLISISITLNGRAQNEKQNVHLYKLLDQFYSEVGNEDSQNALKLSKSIDSILLTKDSLDTKSLAIYNNAKGFIYYKKNLNPEAYLIKADSLNNLLSLPNKEIEVYSSYVLANYYYDKEKDSKAKKAYLKIIQIKDIPEKFNGYKSEAFDKLFFIERVFVNNRLIDSTVAQNTSQNLIKFKKSIKDTLNISYGKALNYIGKKSDAEKLFLAINRITAEDVGFNRYTKFQALDWLNSYYYESLNYNIEDFVNAEKLIQVSEELLNIIKDTDYYETHNVYSLYGDIVIASLITKDSSRIIQYEKKIIDILNSSDYPKKIELNLKRFYYTLHKLKMYYEFDKNYEKAKFYAFQNVELTKYLYGEISVEHEQELSSYESIIKLKLFNYKQAYEITLSREHIIKSLFTEHSKEYLDILFHKYHIFSSQFEYKKGLEVLEKAVEISNKINCQNTKICDDIWFSYLESLNINQLYDEVLNHTKNLTYANDYASLFRISKIRRNAYYGLENFIAINFEFEWLLEQIANKTKDILNDKNLSNEYYSFILDYQEHLRSTGRLEKALNFSNRNFEFFENKKTFIYRNKFFLNYLNILLQLNKCSIALEFIENNETLKFDDITTPISKTIDNNEFQNRLGRIYNCLGETEKAIEAYKKIKIIDGIENNYELVSLELSRLYNLNGNKEESKKYLSIFEKNFKNESLNDINVLYLLVDHYITNDQGEKALKYLIPLSEKIMDEICFKSFFSNNDNKTDKLMHDETLSNILSLNNTQLYNPQLSANAEWISNLYKKRLDHYTQINLDIQKLKVLKNPDALKLQDLENEFNKNASKLLEDEIEQIRSKIISSRISNYEGLCTVDFNKILNSVNESELIIDLIGYKNKKTGFEDFAVNFIASEKGLSITEIHLDNYYKLYEKKNLESGFFEIIFKEILQNKQINGELINTIYIIPSGKSNLINFSAYSLTLDEKFNRKINVHVINSLADIPKIKKEVQRKIDNLILIGDIDYDNSDDSLKDNNLTRGIQLTNSIENSGIPLWAYLPGTKKEIEEISKIALKNNINASIISENDVTESNLKKIIINPLKNNVIHVATHGYFFPDNIDNGHDNFYATHKNPLLRSGLILSGANENWNNKGFVDPNNDGILTAEEISFMDLSGVELIVLSACDTGLGEVSNLEGINGLQRAFKLAGANKLIMSLWKVPDEETSEFFVHFYKFLLDKKLSINEAFRETQKIMKDKYEPYYWASFILLG